MDTTFQRSSRLKKAVGVTLICALPMAGITGCDTVEDKTGLNQETQIGAGAGAAAGGVLAAIAGANPAWIAASAVLGAVAGGFLGEYLSREDAEKHAENQYSSLQTLQEGGRSRWTNPDTGNSGSTTVTEVFTMADGTQCKNFTETIDTGEHTINESGTACKAPGGEWEVRKS